MERTCERAVAVGLSAVAFTEHVDYASWIVRPEDLDDHPHLKAFVGTDGDAHPAGARPRRLT